jgi:hypothetical protein
MCGVWKGRLPLPLPIFPVLATGGLCQICGTFFDQMQTLSCEHRSVANTSDILSSLVLYDNGHGPGSTREPLKRFLKAPKLNLDEYSEAIFRNSDCYRNSRSRGDTALHSLRKLDMPLLELSLLKRTWIPASWDLNRMLAIRSRRPLAWSHDPQCAHRLPLSLRQRRACNPA